MPTALEKLAASALTNYSRQRFRGEIYDYARNIRLGAGYFVPETNVCRVCAGRGVRQCKHFEIDTCRQLIGPFKALLDPNVRVVMLLKAVQTLGSLVWDLTLHYLIVHSPYMKIKIFIDSIDKTRRYCDDRLMPTLKRNPDIAPMLPVGQNRFDEQKTSIFFQNGKSIEVLALNDNNASSLSADFVVIDEGWLHGSDGLMQKAIDRTKQAATTGNIKIFIVGQAGKKDEDQDKIWNRLNKRVLLSWACPRCNGRQTFGEHGPAILRQEGFVPVATDLEPPKVGSYAGLKCPKKHNEVTTSAEIKANAEQAFLECYHCGHQIHDTPEERDALQQTYEQEYREPSPGGGFYTPENYEVGFWNPDPVSVTVPFAGTMLEYISAKKANEELGNIGPLEDFYKNRWATAWSQNIYARVNERPAVTIYDLDPSKKFPGEKVRISATDIQFRMTHMVYLAVAVGDGTPPWVLHYEWIKPPAGFTDQQAQDFCKNRVRELDKQFGIEPQNSMKDGAHEHGLVREWSAEDAIWARMKDGGRIVSKWVGYGVLLGDDRQSYRWPHPGRKDTWERFKQYQWYKVPIVKNGKRVVVDVHTRLWSNPSIKEIAERWRDGSNAPKLQIHDQFLSDGSRDGLWAQLNSERLIPWKGHPGKMHYNNEGRPNHAWDALCMIFVRMDELGYLSAFAPPKEDDEAD